mmetsp:Transcript_9691/g.23718  ORF Transcript_9691/g.23718 Transcript_9691/m.23718 type:complete len:157 (-) Transcript_9691:3224-3694(-)
MKSLLKLLSLLLAMVCVSFPTSSAFVMRPSEIAQPRTVSGASPATSSTSLNVFGTKKSKAQKEAEAEKAAMYWEGEWVCKDCGYIYQRFECAGLYFEEQGAGFRCPQCSGPRRRYAKKVGDRVGTTLDGGDAPILIFSIGGLILTVLFGVWAVDNL